jgi:hypothetical protein
MYEQLLRASVPPGPHPEFGYLCPSQGFRRKVRAGVVLLAFLGMGLLALKVVQSSDLDGTAVVVERAATTARDGEARPGAETDRTLAKTSLPDARPASSQGGKPECEQDARSRECQRATVPGTEHPPSAGEALALGVLPSSSSAPQQVPSAADAGVPAQRAARPRPPARAAKKPPRTSPGRNGAYAYSRDRYYYDDWRYVDRPPSRHPFWGW